MKKEEPKPETQQKHYEVDYRDILPLERAGGNVREEKNYGDLDSLAKSISERGVRMPVNAYRDENEKGKWRSIDGHRRLAACKIAHEKYGYIARVKVIAHDRNKITNTGLLYDMILTNDGKPLTVIELAKTVQKLIEEGEEPKKIASSLGKPDYFVRNLQLFSTSPQRIREAVESGQVGYTNVIRLLQSNKDFNEVVKIIDEAINIAKQSGPSAAGPKKAVVTKRHLDKAQNKVDSIIELRRVINTQESNPRELKNIELYNVLKKILNNKLTKQQYEELLY